MWRVPLFLLIALHTVSPGALAGDGPFGEVLSPSVAIEQIDAGVQRASREGKLLLVVLGANWCHDSTEFAARMAQAPFAELLQQRYESVLVNVGDMTQVRPLMARFGEAAIYGTPTVLVVEPESGQVLNGDSIWRWRDTSQIPAADTAAAFSAYRPGQQLESVQPLSKAHAGALEQIDRFESVQAERIYAAYAQLGQLLKNDAGKPGEQFQRDWQSLAAMRSAITGDLARLRLEAAQQAAAGVAPIELDYPHYSLFTDASR
jgi:hypothetical protein